MAAPEEHRLEARTAEGGNLEKKVVADSPWPGSNLRIAQPVWKRTPGMATDDTNPLLRHLRRLTGTANAENASDHELVQSFVADRDDAAFTALFRRHGPMVHRLCRRVLHNEQDADDAFQATFLVFARKARFLRSSDLLSSWLYGVAYRTALKARCTAARRRAHETAAPVRVASDPLSEMTIAEVQGVVDQEIADLPDKFRAPLVLCCLEGFARDEAARQLGWTVSVLKSRLEQAREWLRRRLARRGLTLPAALLALGTLATTLQAAVPPALAATTVKATILVASGAATAPGVSANAVRLAEMSIKGTLLVKGKVVPAVVLALVVLGIGVTGAALHMRTRANPQTAAVDAPKVQAPERPSEPAEFGQKPEPPKPKAESLTRWGQSEAVFSAHLTRAVAGPVGRSEPPLYTTTLHLRVVKVLRGSLQPGDEIVAVHSVRQNEMPVFPEGREVLVALNIRQGRKTVQAVTEATTAEMEQAELACSVPQGWSVENGRLLSPWANLGRQGWPAEAKGKGPFLCAETGRPALFVGPGVEFTAEPVPPKVVKPGNPDGDGEYRITVKNVTDKPATIPALLSQGKEILWDESLVILCQNKVYTIPGARGVAKPPQPTVLQPGESVSGVVNVLRLQGPEWPRGGYRIEFQFCLGEKSVLKSFYYTSKHHDPLREQLATEK
jgi:RNA polymerase sigma factor (sigma-70 family)